MGNVIALVCMLTLLMLAGFLRVSQLMNKNMTEINQLRSDCKIQHAGVSH